MIQTRGRSSRRKTSWSQGPRGTLSISTNAQTIFASGAQANVPELTLVRVRGELWITLSTVDAALSGFPQVAVGICNVTENAFGAGATAIPAPITDINWDGWLWFWQGRFTSPSGTLTDADGATNARIVIDSKAMRKVHVTDTLVGVIQTTGEIGTATMVANMETRVLDKLP